MNKPTILATLVLLLVISGCATTTKYPKMFDYKNSQNGIMYGTVTYEGEYSGYRVFYKGEGGTNKGWVQTGEKISWTFPESFLHRYGIEGDVFAVELAPGKYTFYWWWVGSGLPEIGATSKFDIQIEGNDILNFRQTLWQSYVPYQEPAARLKHPVDFFKNLAMVRTFNVHQCKKRCHYFKRIVKKLHVPRIHYNL